jgi:hypothetical protein
MVICPYFPFSIVLISLSRCLDVHTMQQKYLYYYYYYYYYCIATANMV